MTGSGLSEKVRIISSRYSLAGCWLCRAYRASEVEFQFKLRMRIHWRCMASTGCHLHAVLKAPRSAMWSRGTSVQTARLPAPRLASSATPCCMATLPAAAEQHAATAEHVSPPKPAAAPHNAIDAIAEERGGNTTTFLDFQQERYCTCDYWSCATCKKPVLGCRA